MTAVGKILVFFNLVFAFVVGTFAVLDYIARTHWVAQYQKLEKSHTVVVASNATYKSENDKFVQQKEDYAKALAANGVVVDPKAKAEEVAKSVAEKLKQHQDDVISLKDELKREKDKNTLLDNELVKYKATATVSQADVARREENEKKLRESLVEMTKLNSKLTDGINYMRDRAVAAEIESKSLKGRNVQLEDKLQEMAREVVRLKATGGGSRTGVLSASGRNPPPEQVEGLVQKVDGDLVMLTIGSDAGLQKGHTMFVFGLTRNVGYRGEIKLVEVTPKGAVGELIRGKQVSRIQVGDTVASDIMPRR